MEIPFVLQQRVCVCHSEMRHACLYVLYKVCDSVALVCVCVCVGVGLSFVLI